MLTRVAEKVDAFPKCVTLFLRRLIFQAWRCVANIQHGTQCVAASRAVLIFL